jgi:hypothetical protein
MLGGRFSVAVIATILALSSSASAQEPRPDAMLQIKQTSVGLVFGYTWGSGTLAFADKTYKVEVDGFALGALGVAQAVATGEVFNLKKLEHFNGTYFAASAEGTAVSGAGAYTMQNGNGVVIYLFTTTEGFNVKVAPEGVRLTIK